MKHNKYSFWFCWFSVFSLFTPIDGFCAKEFPGWPPEVKEILVTSSADGSEQPSLAWIAPNDGTAKPLLVGFHTWSDGYQRETNGPVFARWAIQEGWHFIHPHFRGPNNSPEAMGSDLAVQDILDAVRYMQKHYDVDASRIYLIGSSGGGHMALLMAGRHPEIWAGVSAWVPITDIASWHAESSAEGKPNKYARMIEHSLGGPPDTDERRAEAQKRSPVEWLPNATGVPIDINHGVNDGRAGSVPFVHSLLAFNRLASPDDRLPETEISRYYETQERPANWDEPIPDPLYGKLPVLFRKTSGNSRVTIFDGGHQIHYVPALNWLAQQRKGQPAVWEITDPKSWEPVNTASGK